MFMTRFIGVTGGKLLEMMQIHTHTWNCRFCDSFEPNMRQCNYLNLPSPRLWHSNLHRATTGIQPAAAAG